MVTLENSLELWRSQAEMLKPPTNSTARPWEVENSRRNFLVGTGGQIWEETARRHRPCLKFSRRGSHGWLVQVNDQSVNIFISYPSRLLPSNALLLEARDPQDSSLFECVASNGVGEAIALLGGSW